MDEIIEVQVLDETIDLELKTETIEVEVNNLKIIEVSRIDDVLVNDESVVGEDKIARVIVPTKTSDLENTGADNTSPYATEEYVDTYGGKIDKINIDETELEIENKTVTIPLSSYLAGLIEGVSYNNENGVLTFTKHDQSTVEVDLPLEEIVEDGYYDTATKELVLVLVNGNEIRVPVGDLVNEYYGDNETIELFTDTEDNNKLKFRVKQSVLDAKVDKVTGSSLVADTEISKLSQIEAGAEVNIIEEITVDNVAVTVTGKSANIDLSGKENKLPEAPEDDPEDYYIGYNEDGQKVAKKVVVSSGGVKSNIYFSNQDSDVVGYKKLSNKVDETLTILERTAQLSTSPKLFYKFLFDLPVGTDVIAGGDWIAQINGRIDYTENTTRLLFKPFVYHEDGTESYLFSTPNNSAETSPIKNIAYDWIEAIYTSEQITVLPTDRVGVEVYITTNRPSPTKLEFRVGNGFGSHVNLPLTFRHDDTRGKNDNPDYQHITLSEKEKLETVESGAEANIIETLRLNDVLQTVENKEVNLSIPLADDYFVATNTLLPFTSNWRGITYNGEVFLAITSGYSYIRSLDAKNWITMEFPTSEDWKLITHGDGKFVVFSGYGNKGLFSTDGYDWEEITLPLTSSWSSLVYGGNKFVAVSHDSDKSIYSIDGINWIEADLPLNYWSALTYGDGKFVAIASNSLEGAYSIDGINWSTMEMPLSRDWDSIAYGDGKFIAIASSSDKGTYSIDGIDWEEITLPFFGYWKKVVYGGNAFVAIADSRETTNFNQAAYSIDGKKWTALYLPEEIEISDMSFGYELFVTVSNSQYSFNITRINKGLSRLSGTVVDVLTNKTNITNIDGGFSAGAGANVPIGNAVQLGKGNNWEEKTLKVYDYKIMNEDGTIPTERLPIQNHNNLSGIQGGASGYYYHLTSEQVAKVDNAILKTEMTLTAEEKTQVRTNIGAGTSNFSGSYTDLTNQPTIPTNSSFTLAGLSEKSYNSLTNKPDLSLKLDKKPNGTADLLDSNNKINTVYVPDFLLGQMVYGGSFNATSSVATLSSNAKTKLGTTNNTITLTNNTTAITGYTANEGIYYLTNTIGTFAGITFEVGDWLVANIEGWEKIDNTDAVTGVKGNAESTYRIGNINITPANIGLGNAEDTADLDKPISTAMQTALNLKATKLNIAQDQVPRKTGAGTGEPNSGISYTTSATASTLMYRDADGRVRIVAGTEDTHAVNKSQLDTKDVQPYSQHSTGVGNGYRLVAKFDYSASPTGDTRKVFKFKVKQGHGNGASYVFWGDYIVGLGTSSQITCSGLLSKSDGTFGKCGYRLDAANHAIYFYIYTGQYSAYFTSDITSLTQGTTGTVTWYTESGLTTDAVVEGVNTFYPTSSGTLAITSQIPTNFATEIALNNVINNTTLIEGITGGFAAGKSANVETAFAGSGGAAVGDFTKTTTGGAIGLNAESVDGFAGGYNAYTTGGGALGSYANSLGGGAVGNGAQVTTGGAIGFNSYAGAGFAGGFAAKTISGTTAINAIQLGTGTNSTPNTLQIYNYRLMNADGIIPRERINIRDINKIYMVQSWGGATSNGLSLNSTGTTNINNLNSTQLGDNWNRLHIFYYYNNTARLMHLEYYRYCATANDGYATAFNPSTTSSFHPTFWNTVGGNSTDGTSNTYSFSIRFNSFTQIQVTTAAKANTYLQGIAVSL